jgi:hypothetical protein
MSIHPVPWVLSAMICAGAALPVSAQPVYKCGPRQYSYQPCSKRLVKTDPTEVVARPNPDGIDARKVEEGRVLAASLRRKPGETADQFESRRRRARMMAADRAECARLDTRMPYEIESMKNPDPAEAAKAEAGLANSKKRFSELRC